ncbi:glucuronate isomerase [Arthrobacter jinronghuae]|uniref:glucuronate isomerase n=1 Tax=Arthrobacter TaxID=1663 RepID=UPI00210630BD|nr:glucuronate isomerase [Arthrobacter jinronghuae]MCQ1952631.1 glucuronate isomerase [Arthrobacter sp. zg-Y238]MCQ1955246.1 glucuronate isomerase [Arthrobacter jinronghuae]
MSEQPPGWTLDPDRALPAEPGVRALAREIYAATSRLPIVSMHGHVEVDLLVQDSAFENPAELFVIPDHYLVRMLVSQGESPADLGIPTHDGTPFETDPREIWRRFCRNWKLFRGTPTRYWLEHELAVVFGAPVPPSEEAADELYDFLLDTLSREEFRPRALLDAFNVELLATTDSAASTLAGHRKLAETDGRQRVLPTFRPDDLLHIRRPGWVADIRELSEVSGIEAGDFDSFLAALRGRRAAFLQAGARATDHGHLSADTTPLDPADAREIYAAGLRGEASPAQADAFAGGMLFEMARMSAEDGLVMQLHPGVLRNHHRGIRTRYGTDQGFDIPVRVEFTRALQPLLNSFGMDPAFRMVVFTTDETVYSRELAPLAGAYPGLRLGAPWWFLDSPEQMRRFRESAVETAGFYNTSGFVDDTRALASIPARHDLARRIDAGFLARLVAEGRLGLDEAVETGADLAYHLPLQSYAPRS